MGGIRRWDAHEVSFEMLDDDTDDPVITLAITTPLGRLLVIADARLQGRTLVLSGLHMQGASANAVGAHNVLTIARAFMEGAGYDELVIEGATRTTGANPGHQPRPFRLTRQLGASPARGPDHPKAD